MAKITNKTTLKEIFSKPELFNVLKKYSLPCLSCPLVVQEMENLTIEKVCRLYGIDLKKILKELNEKLKKTC